MPRLGLLLAALTPTRAWWERHAQDSSVLTLSVPAGDSFVRATQKLAEDCDLQESEAAIVDAFRGGTASLLVIAMWHHIEWIYWSRASTATARTSP